MFEKELENIDYVRSHHFLLIQAIELAGGVIVVSLLLWFFIIRDPFIRWVYGSSGFSPEEVSMEMKRVDLEKNTSLQSSVIRGLNIDIRMTFKQKINVNAAVLNIQKYGFWGTYARGSRGNALYDKIAPYDVALAFGNAGKEQNFNALAFKSDYRYFEARVNGRWEGLFNGDEFGNYMIIPSGKNIEAGLSLLKVGDIAEFEGYITELENDSSIKEASNMKATNQGKVEIKNGGTVIRKEAEIIYLTKLSFNGRVFQ